MPLGSGSLLQTLPMQRPYSTDSSTSQMSRCQHPEPKSLSLSHLMLSHKAHNRPLSFQRCLNFRLTRTFLVLQATSSWRSFRRAPSPSQECPVCNTETYGQSDSAGCKSQTASKRSWAKTIEGRPSPETVTPTLQILLLPTSRRIATRRT